MKTIMGKYFIFAKVADCSHTLANNDRNANFGISGAQKLLDVYSLGEPDEAAGRLVFPVDGNINIKRLRINTDGAPGLQAGTQHFAAEFNLDAAIDDSGTIYKYDSVLIRATNFNTWFDCNLTLTPSKRRGGHTSAQYVGLSVNPTGCKFYCDDFNIQSDYEGEGVNISIEMEIDAAAGVVSQSNGWLF